MIPCPRVAEIQEVVAKRYGLPPVEMISERRSRAIAHPRQLAIFLSRALTGRSFPEIGRMFGGRDHSTIIHAVRAVEGRLATDADLNDAVRTLSADVALMVADRFEGARA
jgi:chromosomal replication initiator protein